jgi:cell filamentation protein
VSYEAQQDPLCYPRTNVLINFMGLTDQRQLDQFELSMYLSRAEEPLPAGDLGYEHYKAIHHHLFQDVYAWAGQPRTIRIAKGGNWFCYPEHLDRMMKATFDPAAISAILASPGPDEFAPLAAHLLSEINAGHPFREGNGRTQLVYLNLLSASARLGFNPDLLEPDRVMASMIESFAGNLVPLTELISQLTT